jgi:hypothetical protein
MAIIFYKLKFIRAHFEVSTRAQYLVATALPIGNNVENY